jgi:hypothetical protein
LVLSISGISGKTRTRIIGYSKFRVMFFRKKNQVAIFNTRIFNYPTRIFRVIRMPSLTRVHQFDLPLTSSRSVDVAVALYRRGSYSTWHYIYGRPHVNLQQPDGWRKEHIVAGQSLEASVPRTARRCHERPRRDSDTVAGTPAPTRGATCSPPCMYADVQHVCMALTTLHQHMCDHPQR